MKTVFIILSVGLFLIFSTVTFSQQSFMAEIPGATAYALHYYSSFGGNSGVLAVGKGQPSYIYRSYITWNNIRSYIPLGSVVTNVVFNITWNGSQTAQLEFREFIGGIDWEEKWNNIEAGELWGTRVSSTTEYSFTALIEEVQNSVIGGNNYVWIGIKNQNETNSDYYVSSPLSSVTLEVSYTLTTTVTQVDELGNSFGQVGLWLTNDWYYINVPFGLELQPSSNLGLQSDTNYNAGTYQKYWQWTQNSESFITNHHNFTIQSGVNEITSTFKTADEGVRIKNDLELTGLDGGLVEFADPWLIDYPDPLFGYTERNRGMKQTGDDSLLFYSRQSPFEPDYENYYKGVFLNQTPDPQNPDKPYYKVGMLQEQLITVNGQERKFFPYKWTGTDVNFQDEYTRTGVVFTSSNAEATAVLKCQLMSNDQNGISSSSQRKIVRTDNGKYHVVYESMGTVFYAHSATSDFYGEWHPDQIILPHGKNPSIAYAGDIVKVVCEEYDPQVGGDANIWYFTFQQSLQGSWYENTDDDGIATYNSDYYGNAKPVISYTYEGISTTGEIFAAYRTGTNGGIKQRTKFYYFGVWSDWTTETDIPGTSGDAINPAVAGQAGYIHIAYEDFGRIMYKYLWRQGSSTWNFSTATQDLSAKCGYSNNKYPSISISNGPLPYVMVSWLGTSTPPQNPIPKETSGGSRPMEVAIVKTYNGTNWGTPSIFGSGVNYTNNGSINTSYGSIMSWSELNGQYSKYVRRRNATGYDAITPLSANGIHTMVSNGSEFGNMKAMVFDRSTDAPYLLNRCTNDFTYIPDELGKTGETQVVDIFYGRSGVVEKNGIEFVFNIGDVLLDGVSVRLIERVDTLPVTTIEEINTFVRTESFNLNPESELIFSDYYYVINFENSDSLLSNEFNVNFKCELVQSSTGDVVGLFEQVNYNKTNLEEYGIKGYLVDCSGIETGNYYLRLSTTVNEAVGLSLSDIQNDNVILEKSKLNVTSFRGESIPDEYSLEQNYPNPFNPTTTIKYQIPKSGTVTLKVYDILGAEVAALVDAFQNEGWYEINFVANNLSSGVYLYRISVNNFVDVKKMVVIK